MDESTKLLFGLYVAIISSILAGLVAIVVCVINNVIASKKIKADSFSQSSKTYKELITTERIKWLGLLRESMVEFIAKLFLTIKEKHIGNSFNDNSFHEIVKLSVLIQLRLNPKQDNHIEVLQKIGDVLIILDEFLFQDEKITSEEMIQSVGDLAKSCQGLLKEEWDFVKLEAKPDKNT